MWYIQNRTEFLNHYIFHYFCPQFEDRSPSCLPDLPWEAAAKVSDFIVSIQMFFEVFFYFKINLNYTWHLTCF